MLIDLTREIGRDRRRNSKGLRNRYLLAVFIKVHEGGAELGLCFLFAMESELVFFGVRVC